MRYDRIMAVSGFALTLTLAPLSAQAADIVETLKNSGQYSQLVEAIDKAGLTETLSGEGPYTVFAPTDEAFQKLQQSPQGGDGQVLQQVSSEQLKQILTHHVVEGQELGAQDVLGKEQKVETMSGDQLTIDGTGTVVVLVPTGLTVSRVGDEVFVRREVAAIAQPAVTVSPAGQQGQQQGQGEQAQQQQGQQAAQSGQQGQQQGQQGQQQAAGQTGQQGQQQGQQGQQQAAQSGQQGQQQGQQGQEQAAGQTGGQMQAEEQPMTEQQGLLRAAMVVEPGIQADNGVIHGIDQVLVPQKIEQQLMSGQGQSSGQQDQG